MTEEYRRELISRIEKLNFTNKIFIKRICHRGIFCLCSLFLGVFAAFVLFNEKDYSLPVAFHICSFFNGLNLLQSVRAVICYAADDCLFTLIIFLLGYTMVTCGGGKLLLAIYSVRSGIGLYSILDVAVLSGIIDGGISAFVFFLLTKLIIFAVLVFASIKSEDFSYGYRSLCDKIKYPILSKESKTHIITTLSSVGFTIIINALYLIFQHLCNYSIK